MPLSMSLKMDWAPKADAEADDAGGGDEGVEGDAEGGEDLVRR